MKKKLLVTDKSILLVFFIHPDNTKWPKFNSLESKQFDLGFVDDIIRIESKCFSSNLSLSDRHKSLLRLKQSLKEKNAITPYTIELIENASQYFASCYNLLTQGLEMCCTTLSLLHNKTLISTFEYPKTIAQCLDIYQEKNFFCKHQLAFTCKNCSRQGLVEFNIRVLIPPDVLLLHVHRYEHEHEHEHNHNDNDNYEYYWKNDSNYKRLISYPITNMLMAHKQYNLTGVCNHFGSTRFGDIMLLM